MNKKKIFIACDTNKISEAQKIINKTKTKQLDIGYKFGLEFFYSKKGREFISQLKGNKIFLDIKISNNITNATLLHYAQHLKMLTTEHTNQNQKTDTQHTPNQNLP